MAYILSSTFATHNIRPEAMNSRTRPRAGNSDLTAILTSVMLGFSAISIASRLLETTLFIARSPGGSTGVCHGRNIQLFVIEPIDIRNGFGAHVLIQFIAAQK